MSSILILSRSLVASDPRVRRQIDALIDDHSLTVAAYGPCPFTNLNFIEWPRYIPSGRGYLGKLKKFMKGDVSLAAIVRTTLIHILTSLPEVMKSLEAWQRAMRHASGIGVSDRILVEKLRGHRFDLVIANDLSSLGTGAALKGTGRLLYDAHEYHPGHQPNSAAWRRHGRPVAMATLARFLPVCDAVTTVCEGIAQAFTEDFKIPLPVVITNTPSYRNLEPIRNTSDPIRLVHHGLASRKRGFETMIDAMKLLGEGYSLDLYLSDSGSVKARQYVIELTASLKGDSRVRVLPPMPMPEIPERINSYDIGLAFFPPKTFNLLHALPNKFFEYVQARLAIVSGPSPDMASIIMQHGMGVVAEGFDASQLARAIRSLDRGAILQCKKRAHASARELAAEPQIDRFRNLIKSLIN